MKGDEEKCRAAGMDDYLSKPIDRTKLDASLERLLPSAISALAAPAEMPRSSNPPHLPVDWESLLNSIDGDKGFARDLADAFIGTVDREVAAIISALGSGDAAALRNSAHTLKGASANLRAAAAAAAAARLESATGAGMSAEVPALADDLIAEVRRTTAYLRSAAG
jgi:HPt (histidine-containing phosphotransfer) domain-containing protein